MKKIIGAALLIICAAFAYADIDVPFFGNNNFTIDANTTFTGDIENGTTGLYTVTDVGLWFEFTPYSDRNIPPLRDTLSVSLKLANSAFYAWRGYGEVAFSPDGAVLPSMYGGRNQDQAKSIWFDTFIAQLEYGNFWLRMAGIEPELTLSQASIKSVFDPIYANRSAKDKNEMFLPLLRFDSHYNPNGIGISSIIGRDLLYLNRREVVVAGNFSAGLNTDELKLTLKAGTWKAGAENTDNSWIGGLDLAWRPDLVNYLTFSFLGAINYGEISVDDKMSNPTALVENPLAFGLGYEYRISIGSAVIRPYVGVDFIWETKTNEYNYEIGGGLQWFFRGLGPSYKRNTTIGGSSIGDVGVPVALFAGVNVNKNGICNAIISYNENPRFSLIPNVGGFFAFEFMNIAGKDYIAPDGKMYNQFIWAGMLQIEYYVNDKILPYVFAKYMPSYIPYDFNPVDSPVFNKLEEKTILAKAGCRFTPFQYFYIDVWYEMNFFYTTFDNRKDGLNGSSVGMGRDWVIDKGRVSLTFGVRNYN